MRTRPSLPVAALTAVLAGALLAGCGGDGGSGDSGAPPDVTATGGPTVSGSPPGSASELPGVSENPVPSGGITITGTPTEGVESGCIVMQVGDTLYLLLGGERSVLMSGRPVVVRGRPSPGLMTTCQQGTPFQVTDVQPA